MAIGILLGLGAATSQSLSYLFSGHYVRTFRSSIRELLVLAHVVMAAVCVGLLPFVWPDALPPVSRFGPPLVGGALFYLCGQIGLFMALRTTEASRVSPLLGLKLPILALISVLFLDRSYSPLQWVAVGICLTAAFLLNRSGVRVSLRGFGWILTACLGYCLSDLNIKLLVTRFGESGMTLARSSLVGACLSYLLCGIVALMLLPTVSWRDRSRWRCAIPFAAAWFCGMLLLFACFGAIGVVFGNIVQSTRGLLSVVIGVMIARAGYLHLETVITRRVLVRRIAAAALMILAIALFSAGSRRRADPEPQAFLFSPPRTLSYADSGLNP